jgi:uncharacterized OB-fold protein
MSESIASAAERIAALGDSAPGIARDPVNLPMIRSWVEAIGGSVPSDDVAPPAMIQVWTMAGLHGVRDAGDPLSQMMRVLDEAGYPSVVATNCAQEYFRYLKIGEQLTIRGRLLGVTGPKKTALGEGWFVTTRNTWYSGGEPVATMDWRILKFRPPQPPPVSVPSPEPEPEPPDVMRPQVSRDTAFFWAGTRAGELRVQRCAACGALRHPPGPMCPACGAASAGDYVVAAGTGEVYSYVVHHHPPVPGKELPVVIALVALPEGVRMVGELRGVVPDEVRVGMPVQVLYDRIDDELTLPSWWPGGPSVLPPLTIDVTPTFVISTALATRDFTEVHHDRDIAVRRGSKDIFVNILTTTGLVQRYVTDWAGPQAIVRSVGIRLGVPCYAGDRLTLTGQVVAPGEIAVTGRCRLGNHVTGTVRIEGVR